MELDEKPTEDYSDIGGCDKQIQELIEAVVLPMTHGDRFKALGIRPPKGVLLHGPPGACGGWCGVLGGVPIAARAAGRGIGGATDTPTISLFRPLPPDVPPPPPRTPTRRHGQDAASARVRQIDGRRVLEARGAVAGADVHWRWREGVLE